MALDAMVHDSASFLAEYLYLDKPVQFIQSVKNIRDYFSEFGVDAFEACEHARSFEDIKNFISGISREPILESPKRAAFFRKNIEPYFATSPSEKIVNHLKGEFPKLGSVPAALRSNS